MRIKPKRNRKAIIIFTIVLIVLLVAFLHFRNERLLEEARLLYIRNEYMDAYATISQMFLPSNSATIQKIRLGRKVGYCYEVYYQAMNPSYGSPDADDYREALLYLTFGVEACNKPENQAYANENNLNDELTSIRQLHYNGLLSNFRIIPTEADELAELDSVLVDDKIREIANEKYEEEIAAEKKAEELKRNPVEFYDLEWDTNSVYTIATGSIKNISNFRISFVEIKVAFKDEDDNVVDTGWTYAVGTEGLAPGESSKWKVFVDSDFSIAGYYVYVLDYQ